MRVFQHRSILFFVLAFGMLAALASAQDPGPRGDGPPPPGFGDGPRGRGDRDMGGPGRPALHLGPPGRWWDDPTFAQKIGISPEQKKKMDEIFTASRLKLIDLVASVQKEEVTMEPLVESDPPDEAKVLAQIDRVAQARAELEKANTRMLFELRRQLNHDQWVKLQAERPPRHEGGREHRGPDNGPGRGGDGPGKPPGE
jgi:Spy/CpxP family protein refolding chaperone